LLTIYPLARIVACENITSGIPVTVDEFPRIVDRDPVTIGNSACITAFFSLTGRDRSGALAPHAPFLDSEAAS
jgi:acetyltransferase-like isoleucine patch superfamily enzyme